MPSQAEEASGDRSIAVNRRARHLYEVLETVEAGLVLRGTEVKSLRAGQVNFKDSYATVRSGEGWLLGCHISPYSHGTDANHNPERDRKLLLHRRELARLSGKIAERGLTSLLAPVARVTGYDTVMPLPRLEQRYIPSVSRIVAAARKVCEFA